MQTSSIQKTVGIVIGLFVLVLLGFLFMGKDSTGTPSNQSGSDGAETTSDVSGDTVREPSGAPMAEAKASFKELLGMAGAQKCTVSQESTLSKSTGIFYLSNGKGRGDFESTVLSGPGVGTVSKNSMIMDGDTIYTWDAATKQGMKISMAELANGSETTGTTQTSSSNAVTADQFNQTYDYDCENWRADASIFVQPADVTFVDMAEMMKGMPNLKDMTPPPGSASAGAGMDMSAMCASCEQAGDQRNACRAALGCK